MPVHSVERVEVPPVTVRSDDQVTTVPSWPMPLAGVNKRTVELEQDEKGNLVLGLKPGSWRSGILMILCVLIPGLLGVGLTMYTMYQEANGPGRVIWWGGMLLLGGFLALLLLSYTSRGTWVHFDSWNGVITFSRRPFGFFRAPRISQTILLADLACLQLIYNGFHSEDIEIGAGDQKSYQNIQYSSYQMNLVLKGENSSRINLAHHSDWEWMRRAGGQLAEYLKIPLADQLYHA